MHPLFKRWKEKRVILPINFSEDFLNLKYKGELIERITFDLSKGFDYFYARSGHKNYDDLEKLLVLAEAPTLIESQDIVDAAVFSSGMGAISAVIDSLAKGSDGKKFIAGKTLYTSTKEILDKNLPANLEETEFIDTTDVNKVREALERNKGNVVALYFEPVTNPMLGFTKVREVAEIAHEYDVPVVVDNTFLTPYLQNPLMMGADIIIHSLTKYISGEGDMLAGAVIGPYEFINDDGGMKYMRKHKGATLNPRDAHTLSRRMRGLPDRMERHCYNAKAIAEAMESNENVGDVYYPNLGRDTREGYAGGVLSFVIKGDSPEQKIQMEKRFIESINHERVVQHRVSLGEPGTLVVGYSNLLSGLGRNDEEIKQIMDGLGIPLGLIRVSAGREESIEKIINHMNDAVEYACK